MTFSPQEEDSDSPLQFETVPPQQRQSTTWRRFNPEPVSDSSAIPLVFERPTPDVGVPVLKRKTFPQEIDGKEVHHTTIGNRARWIFAALVVFLLGIFWILSLRETGSNGPAEAGNVALYGEAWEQSKRLILEHLKSPNSAKFPASGSISEMPSRTPARRSLLVSSHVDALNADGDVVRANWEVAMTYHLGSHEWAIDLARMDGEYLVKPKRMLLEEEEMAAAADDESRHYVETARWDGSGSKSTEEFRITRGPLRVQWRSSGNISIKLMNEDGTTLEFVAESERGSGQKFIRRSGNFTLEINGTGRAWEVIVSEAE